MGPHDQKEDGNQRTDGSIEGGQKRSRSGNESYSVGECKTE